MRNHVRKFRAISGEKEKKLKHSKSEAKKLPKLTENEEEKYETVRVS